MKKTIPATCLILVVCASRAFAQGTITDRCTVSLVEYPLRVNPSNMREANLPSVELGIFKTVIGEEMSTTVAYRLPGTRMFVIANVFYTDESMVGDSIYFNLSISRVGRYDVLSSLRHASSEVLDRNFEVARVVTLFRYRSRRLYLVMECRRQAQAQN